MKIYRVGGSVRDEILGLPIKDRDFVVVGATADEMIKMGFLPVGKSFPVFLHPKTKEEYALARTERKDGHGYHGFVFDCDSSITIEDDLVRRDLTINAIAKDEDTGELIDPCGGVSDINARVLRHISPAFAEDPLRLFRVARFLAKFSYLGFKIADETYEIMKSLVGEISYLSKERIWLETEKALEGSDSHSYFEVLSRVGALDLILGREVRLDWLAMSGGDLGKILSIIRDISLVNSFDITGIVARLEKFMALPSKYKEYILLLGKWLYIDESFDRAELLNLVLKSDFRRKPEKIKQIFDVLENLPRRREFYGKLRELVDFFVSLKVEPTLPKEGIIEYIHTNLANKIGELL